jgi:hypothetical protein
VAAVAMFLLVSCSSQDSAGAEEQLAGSLTELFRQALDNLNPSPVEREVLERAIIAGQIDPVDYEDAHIRYALCMTQHGFDPRFRKTSEGLYVELPYLFVDNQAALDAAVTKCSQGTSVVESLYQIQQANPDLLADQRLVAVRCLRARGFVDAAYTVEDFEKDRTVGKFPFDQYGDEEANNCLWKAGYAYFEIESS